MYYVLIFAAVVFFLAHVILLFTAFPQSQLAGKRYFYSHLTLWITGAIVFILAVQFSGTGRSPFLDYFNTFGKKLGILLFTFSLSLIAHLIVKFLVQPLLLKSK
ncbi:hypothetical protein [Mucilaginibacter phyllosphaerae]